MSFCHNFFNLLPHSTAVLYVCRFHHRRVSGRDKVERRHEIRNTKSSVEFSFSCENLLAPLPPSHTNWSRWLRLSLEINDRRETKKASQCWWTAGSSCSCLNIVLCRSITHPKMPNKKLDFDQIRSNNKNEEKKWTSEYTTTSRCVRGEHRGHDLSNASTRAATKFSYNLRMGPTREYHVNNDCEIIARTRDERHERREESFTFHRYFSVGGRIFISKLFSLLVKIRLCDVRRREKLTKRQKHLSKFHDDLEITELSCRRWLFCFASC